MNGWSTTAPPLAGPELPLAALPPFWGVGAASAVLSATARMAKEATEERIVANRKVVEKMPELLGRVNMRITGRAVRCLSEAHTGRFIYLCGPSHLPCLSLGSSATFSLRSRACKLCYHGAGCLVLLVRGRLCPFRERSPWWRCTEVRNDDHDRQITIDVRIPQDETLLSSHTDILLCIATPVVFSSCLYTAG